MGGFGIWSEDLFRRETQNSIFQSLWATKNKKTKINDKKWFGPGLAEKRSPN
jgi:hypothetical protein